MTMSDRAPTITAAIARRVIDDELSALIWLLAEAGLPLVVAGRPGVGRHSLAAAFGALVEASGVAGGGDVRQRVVEADSLEEVLGPGSAQPGAVIADQLRGLGLVLVLRDVADTGRRLISAHYLRPVERDAAGHLQHRPPALLAAWDAGHDRLDHFWWGVTSELADRAGRAIADFERAHAERAALLRDLAAAGLDDALELRRAIQASLMSVGQPGRTAARSDRPAGRPAPGRPGGHEGH